MKSISWGTFRVACGLLLGSVVAASAQTNYTSLFSLYSEDFDSMGSAGTTTPNGWFVGSGVGAIASTTVVPNTGSSTTGTNYNYGIAGVNPDTDRALGSLAATTLQRDSEVRIVNNTGIAIEHFSVFYDGEQWRIGASQVLNTLVMQYSTNGTTFVNMGSIFDFTSPRLTPTGAIDGNVSSNRVAGIGGVYIPASPIPNGTTIYLRWADADDGGSDAGMAIDNFMFLAVPEPTAGMLAALALGLGLLRRRRA